jgi:hypothetical protein
MGGGSGEKGFAWDEEHTISMRGVSNVQCKVQSHSR